MGIFDLMTAVVAAIGYAIGRGRGLVWQVSGIGTLVVGGLCATVLSRPLGSVVSENPILGRFVAWVVVYALVAICLYVLTLKLKHRIEQLEFDELDRRFGGALGAAKGVLAFAVVTLVAVALSDRVAEAVKASAAGRLLSVAVHQLHPLVPERVHDAIWPYLRDRLPTEPWETGGDLPAQRPPPTAPQPSPAPTPERAPAVRPPAPPAKPAQRPPAPPAPEPARSTPAPRPLPPPNPNGDVLDAPDVAPDPFDTHQDPPDPLAPPRDER